MIQKYIESNFPVSLYHTVASHGWVHLAPWSWDGSARLGRAERLKSGETVWVDVTQKSLTSFVVEIDTEELNLSEQIKILSNVTRWFSLQWDSLPAIRFAKSLDPRVARFIEQGGGRFLRGSTFYEDLIKTICTINANWAFTVRMVESLVHQLGNQTFPTPVQIVKAGEEVLRRDLKLGFRARVIAELSQGLLNKYAIDEEGNSVGEPISFDDLIKLRGIGQYSASHVAMLCHDFSHIPIDSEVTHYCGLRYKLDPEAIESFFEPWGEYKFLGYKVGRILDHLNWAG